MTDQDNHDKFVQCNEYFVNRDSVSSIFCKKNAFPWMPNGIHLVVSIDNDRTYFVTNNSSIEDCRANRLALIAKHWGKCSTNPTKPTSSN